MIAGRHLSTKLRLAEMKSVSASGGLLKKEEWFSALYEKSRGELIDRPIKGLNWGIDRK
jgi:hypothetical protein